MSSLNRKAFLDTVPVMTGYLVLGAGFGILLKTKGYGIRISLVMSVLIYAGSMQYAAIGLLTDGASLLTVGLTTLMVNARHLFYGISMLEKYKATGKKKPYLIFALTDETYSLVCRDPIPGVEEKALPGYYLRVSFLNQCYWVAGSLIGSAAGTLIHFDTTGIDFALTALFLTIFTEQWLHAKSEGRSHFDALTGVFSALLCLLVFGPDRFLIPAMILIIAVLLSGRKHLQKGAV